MSIFNKITKTFQWGDKTVIMETGEIARQAGGAVLVNIDDTGTNWGQTPIDSGCLLRGES